MSIEKALEWMKKITKKDLIYTLVIVILIGCLCGSIRQCTNTSKEYKTNIEALNDTVKYYQDKNGNLVATKLAFESDIKTLKLLNEDLYNEIKALKAKGDVTSAVHFEGTIENPKQDTAYVVEHDTISKGFYKEFAFNDEWRTLEGNVQYKNDTVGVNIEKDQVCFDYTVALDDENNIMIKSSNPYVKYSEMTGFQVPKEKRKRWSLGPAVNFGYDPINNKAAFSVGVSLNYGIFQW